MSQVLIFSLFMAVLRLEHSFESPLTTMTVLNFSEMGELSSASDRRRGTFSPAELGTLRLSSSALALRMLHFIWSGGIGLGTLLGLVWLFFMGWGRQGTTVTGPEAQHVSLPLGPPRTELPQLLSSDLSLLDRSSASVSGSSGISTLL
uniref:Secreted protein n=1 Tax=Ixodes ricinus TaxID=34613 RepID=A0A6B0UV31_IXORI